MITQTDRRLIRQAAHKAASELQRRLYEALVHELHAKAAVYGTEAVLTDEVQVSAAIRAAAARVMQ